MSRIHEAMTKAAREQTGPDGPNTSPFPADFPATLELERNPAADSRALDAVSHMKSAVPISNAPIELEELRNGCAFPKWCLDPRASAFSDRGVSAMGAEQFRTLRSRLYQLRSERPFRTILVTSAVAQEGKSFVAMNLAQAIVRQPDRRVLVIDADLRSSRQHLLLGAPKSPGLSNYLGGEIDEIAVIQSNQGSNLYFIPAGTKVANPSELLANGRLKRLIQRVSTLFDWILVDSPPCLPVTDANVAADSCDALLLVVRAHSTPVEIAQRAKQELHGRNVLGVVFNSVNEKALKYRAYYDYPQNGHDHPETSTETR